MVKISGNWPSPFYILMGHKKLKTVKTQKKENVHACQITYFVVLRSNYAILGRVTETELYRDTGNCPLVRLLR